MIGTLTVSILSLLTGSASLAATPSACTAAALTRECHFFREQPGTMIRLGDGTAFRNPLAAHTAQNRDVSLAAETKRFEDRLKSRVRAIRAFDSMPRESRVSDAFRMSLEAHLDNKVLAQAFRVKPEATTLLDATPILAWPPTEKDAKTKKVSRQELSAFVNSLPENVRTDVAAAIIAYRATDPASTDVRPRDVVVSAARSTRLRELAEFARQALIDDIAGDRWPDQLSPEEKSQLERLKSLRVRSPEELANHPACAGVEPEAVNNPITNSLGLCPSFANYPDSQLVFLFAHEMSHSFDPCFMRFPLLKINREKLAQLSPSSLPKEIQESADRTKIYQQLKSLPAGGDLTNYEALFVLKDPASLDYFEQQGLVSRVASEISPERDPAAKGYACLRKNFRETTPAELEAFAAAYADAVDENVTDGIDRPQTRAEVSAALQRYPQCAPTLAGGSQMGEAMADAWGAKALGRWLAKNPPVNELERIAAVATFAEDVCVKALRPARSNADLETPRELQRVVQSASRDPHPSVRNRLNLVLLAEPRVREAFRCAAAPSCSAQLGVAVSTSTRNGEAKPAGVAR